MKRVIRLVGDFLFPSEQRILRWASGPPEKRFARQLAVQWAFLLVQIAIFGLVISSEIVGCPTKRDSCNAPGAAIEAHAIQLNRAC